VTAVAAQHGDTAGSAAQRLLAGCLAVVIVLGSVSLWVGVPVAGMWLVGRVTTDAVSAVLFALLAIPLSMVAVGWALYRVSARYESLRGGHPRAPAPPAWRSSLSDERGVARRRRGGRLLIDVSMTASAVAALVLLVVWFFFLAEMRLAPLP
jgi:hypothetical protein